MMLLQKTKIGFVAACAVMMAACTGAGSHQKDAREQESDSPVKPPHQKVVKQPGSAVKPLVRPEQQGVLTPPAPHPVGGEVQPPQVFIPKAPGVRIAQVSVPGPYVALTFDDGPNPATTPRVLDILKRYGAKATFFVLGENAARHKDVVARAAAEGHEIGSHTWSHPQLTKMSQAEIISQLDRTAAVIQEATGRRPAVMRPPYGATNKNVTDLVMSRYGMPSIMWSVDTQDWRHPGVSVVIHRAVDRAQSGSIILLHDIHASTVAAVEGVVAGLQRRGFTLVTVSELVAMGRRAARVQGVAASAGTPESPLVSADPAAAAPGPAAAEVTPAPAAAAAEAPGAPAPEEPVSPEVNSELVNG
ncbi:MAG: polysaccharide deacetylase family protein [Akkermansiaceae bacterium]|nr:polysaccharide deacetylase family protein [Akkermansiaceae bacterium]